MSRYRPWLYAAAVYNLAWGGLNAAAPGVLAPRVGVHDLVLWRVVAMFVLVYAPAYWWAARHPERHVHLVAVALLGKTLGAAGFVWAFANGLLPAAFGLVTLTNDVMWIPPRAAYVVAAALRRGWGALLTGA